MGGRGAMLGGGLGGERGWLMLMGGEVGGVRGRVRT